MMARTRRLPVMFAKNETPKEPRAEPNETTASAPSTDFVYVLIPGSERTYRLRERLKKVGLRWSPEPASWSGTVLSEFIPQMEAEGLQILRCLPIEPAPAETTPEPRATPPSPRARVQKPHARTRRVAPPRLTDEQRAEAFLPEHGWDERDITANLEDDDRAVDEHRVERHLRDLRQRVKAVRALISADPSIQETLTTNREKARAFYAIHGVTEAQVRRGIPNVNAGGLEWEELSDALRGRFPGVPSGPDWMTEEAQRAAAALPESGTEAEGSRFARQGGMLPPCWPSPSTHS